MTPTNADSLRILLRRIAFGLAATSLAACGSVVTNAPGDAGPDVAADTPPVDVPPVDVPMTHDAPPADAPIADAPADDGPPADVDRCAGRAINMVSPCIEQDFLFECGLPAGVAPVDGGAFAMADCERLCGTFMSFPAYTCALRPPDGSGAVVRCNYACGVGRRAAGFHWNDAGCDGLGSWFAHVSALEGAAVLAFDRMAAELRAWGAPDALIDEALGARADEVDHAVVTARFAARFGATPVPFTVADGAPRSLEDAARENVVEGCVRETYGALVAWWQCEHARDAELAAAMRAIADDETRHAALSWRVHAWMRTQLDDAANARVEAARREAVEALRDELRAPLPDAVITWAGLPASADAGALFAALAPSLA